MKYRANALNAILENYSTYEKMLQEYADGDGSMAEEAEKTANSLEGSLNKLSNTWTDTVQNILDSDTLNSGVKVLNTVLDLINKITDSLKYFYSYVNEIELFLTEQDNFLEVKFIIPTNDFVQKEIIDNLSEINIPNISIKNLNNLLVILYKEKLTSYD